MHTEKRLKLGWHGKTSEWKLSLVEMLRLIVRVTHSHYEANCAKCKYAHASVAIFVRLNVYSEFHRDCGILEFGLVPLALHIKNVQI